jgi:hypothetical protein
MPHPTQPDPYHPDLSRDFPIAPGPATIEPLWRRQRGLLMQTSRIPLILFDIHGSLLFDAVWETALTIGRLFYVLD